VQHGALSRHLGVPGTSMRLAFKKLWRICSIQAARTFPCLINFIRTLEGFYCPRTAVINPGTPRQLSRVHYETLRASHSPGHTGNDASYQPAAWRYLWLELEKPSLLDCAHLAIIATGTVMLLVMSHHCQYVTPLYVTQNCQCDGLSLTFTTWMLPSPHPTQIVSADTHATVSSCCCPR